MKKFEVPEWNRYNEKSIKQVKEVIQYLDQQGLRHLTPSALRLPSEGGSSTQQNSGKTTLVGKTIPTR